MSELITCEVCGREHLDDAPCYEDADVEYDVPEAQRIPHRVAPEETQTISVLSEEGDDIRYWPRYAIARKRADGSLYLVLYNPNLTGAARTRTFDAADYETYLRVTNRQHTDLRNSATWGTPERFINYKVCSLVTREGGQTELVFDASSQDPHWTVDVYSLDPVQQKWSKLLRKTLMMMPIQHLRVMHLQTILIDFFMGTERVNSSGLCSGGGNWPIVGSVLDRNKVAGAGITYAALNRAWGDHNNRAPLPTSDSEIDSSFDRGSIYASTIYHECGHLFILTNRRREDFDTQEEFEASRDQLQQIRDHQGLFNDYKVDSEYRGTSQRWGEGFAEAYRIFLMGGRLRAGPNHSGATSPAEVTQLMLELGFPTSRSAQQAARDVDAMLAQHY
jgi:hypothetical protein